MQFGLSIPPFADAVTLVELAVDAEAAGWDGAFVWDHLQWDVNRRVDVHDPWVLLGALAARTERVRLGTLVTPLARRRPWVVAKHLTTLDHLSDGRAVLGVGVGSPSDADFSDFGDLGDDRERAQVLDEGLDLIDGLLKGGQVEHHGHHFDVRAELLPTPVQQPRPPIWVAAIAPYRRGLHRATRWDAVVLIGMPDGYLTPEALAAYLDGIDGPVTWDVVVSWAPGVPADEYVDAGATWLFDGIVPEGDWVAELRDRIHLGPAGP